MRESTSSELAVRYRRLLWTYPRDYRRIRGAELLTTLLDSAPPGATRPDRREAWHLIVGGLGFRLRPPRHWASIVAATLVAVVAGFAVAAVTAVATWELVADEPTADEARTVVSTAFGRPYTGAVEPHRWTWGVDEEPYAPLWIEAKPGPATIWISGSGDGENPGVLVNRMRAAGWWLTTENDQVWAHSDGLIISYSLAPDGDWRLIVHREAPTGVGAVAFLGFVLGGLFGWSATVGALRRLRVQSRARRIWARLAATVGLVATGLVASVCMYVLLNLTGQGPGWSSADGLRIAHEAYKQRLELLVATVFLALAWLVVSVRPASHPPVPTEAVAGWRTRLGARLLASLQLLFLTLWAAAGILYLAGHDGGSAMPVLARTFLFLGVFTGGPLAPFLLAVTMPMVLSAPAGFGLWTRRVLLVGVVGTALLAATWLTPAGNGLWEWVRG